jgi:Protein of unknown function (DUF2283).
MTAPPEITFDKEANAFYIKVKGGNGNVIETKSYTNCVVNFDLDTKDEIVGVEIILRNKGVNK